MIDMHRGLVWEVAAGFQNREEWCKKPGQDVTACVTESGTLDRSVRNKRETQYSVVTVLPINPECSVCCLKQNKHFLNFSPLLPGI